MYVYEEMVDGQKLTEIINTKHENVKYLPGHKLPENVVCLQLQLHCEPKQYYLLKIPTLPALYVEYSMFSPLR